MNILINAYAVSPIWGSEPGMGWNWISNLAKYCNLYIITEGEWQEAIEDAVEKHPYKEHLHFYYLPVTEKVRNMCWNQGDWRFYYYYKQWQKRVLVLAKQLCNEVDIDIIHQLNMVGFREPGYLWKLNKPLIWGPIGGMAEDPMQYLENAPLKARIILMAKAFLSNLQLKYSLRINKAFENADYVIAATPSAMEKVEKYKHKKPILIQETGCYDLKTEISDKRERSEFHILWTGRFIPTKRLDIALRTVAEIKDLPDLKFHILGEGNEKENSYYREMGCKLGLDDICVWHGKVENKKVHEMMRECDLFFFTSVSDATSTVVPEAINNCLPIVCFNACGFGPIVTKKIGRTVELTTPDQSVKDFANQIRTLYNDKQLLYEMSCNCKEALKSLLWEDKAAKVLNIYKSIYKQEKPNH